MHFIQDVRIIPFLQNLRLLFLSRNTGQCPVSSVLEQLLGVDVTTRRPFPSVTSLIFSLVADLQVYQQAYPHTTIHQQSYLKTLIEPFDFSWEWKADFYSNDITTMNLLFIYLHNELILLNTIDGFSWESGIAQ